MRQAPRGMSNMPRPGPAIALSAVVGLVAFAGCAGGAGAARTGGDHPTLSRSVSALSPLTTHRAARPSATLVPPAARWLLATVTRRRIATGEPSSRVVTTVMQLEVRSVPKVNRIRQVLNSLPLEQHGAPAPSCPARTTNTFVDIVFRASQRGRLIATARVAYVSCAQPGVLLKGPAVAAAHLGEGQLIVQAIEAATKKHITTAG